MSGSVLARSGWTAKPDERGTCRLKVKDLGH